MKLDWQDTTLGSAYDVRDGTHDSPKYEETGWPLVTSKNLKESGLDLSGAKYISELDFRSISKRSEVHRGDVLFAMIGTIGNPVVVEDAPDFAIKNVALFKVPPAHDSHYLRYYLSAPQVVDKMMADARGTTQKFVGLGYLRSFPIEIPPLEEQRRIVALLDKAFAGIATATANAQKNLSNARACFETFAEALIEKHVDGEMKATLKSVTDRITNGYVGPTRDIYVDSGIPYLLARQVKNNNLKFDGRTYITSEFNERIGKSKLIAGDVLLVQSGHIGHSAVVPIEHEGHNCHAMIVITPKPNLTGKFLSLFFNTASMKSKFAEIRSGSTVPHLTCKLVRELLIPLPSVSKQIEIERKCCEVRELTLALERNCSQKLAALSELKQSLLQKAFAGELT